MEEEIEGVGRQLAIIVNDEIAKAGRTTLIPCGGRAYMWVCGSDGGRTTLIPSGGRAYMWVCGSIKPHL